MPQRYQPNQHRQKSPQKSHNFYNFFFLFTILVYVSICSTTPVTTSLRDISSPLSSNWRLILDNIVYPVSLPSTVIDDLIFNKVLPENFYYRDNFLAAYKYEIKDAIYYTQFSPSVQELATKNHEIIFEGLDTHAQVFLNGQKILESHNMFRRYQLAVRFHEKNNLTIIFQSAANHDIKQQKQFFSKYGFDLPSNYSFSRKASYHYGWDWGPRILSCGIWKPIYINCYNEIKFKNFQIKQLSAIGKNPTYILSQIKVDISQLNPQNTYQLEIVIKRAESSTNDSVVFENRIQFSLEKEYSSTLHWNITQNVDNYVWWIWELGQPVLFDLSANIKDLRTNYSKQEKIKGFGLRSISLIQKQDANGKGKSFAFHLNGYDIYARGGNYIPPEMSLSKTTDATYKTVIRNARQQNFNMIRVWGGGHFEKDQFYSQCDKAGILIWHDLMFACDLYPYSAEIAVNIEAEMRDNLMRLRHHPSIGLWNGNNEIWIGWQEWGWKNHKTDQQKKIVEEMYSGIFNVSLPKIIKQVTPHIPYWETSPSVSSNKVEYINQGDIHFWRVWGGGTPIEQYQKFIGRFNSEYGMQSMPDISTIEKFTAKGKDRELGSQVLRLHQRHSRGDKYLPMYVNDNTEGSNNLTRFSYFSQVMQSYALELAITSLRGRKPFNMGSLYWQLNDVWPVSSWATIDYYQVKKAAHYQIKNLYEPLLVSVFDPQPDTQGNYVVYVANDYQQTFNCHFQIRVAFFNGTNINNFTVQKRISPLSQIKIAQMLDYSQNNKFKTNNDEMDSVFLHVHMRCVQGQQQRYTYFYSKMKERYIIDPKLSYEVYPAAGQIKVRTVNIATYVWVYEENDGKHYALKDIQDNFFTLIPGQQRTIKLGGVNNIDNVKVTCYEIEVLFERQQRLEEQEDLRKKDQLLVEE